jgi:hypothetical protein
MVQRRWPRRSLITCPGPFFYHDYRHFSRAGIARFGRICGFLPTRLSRASVETCTTCTLDATFDAKPLLAREIVCIYANRPQSCNRRQRASAGQYSRPGSLISQNVRRQFDILPVAAQTVQLQRTASHAPIAASTGSVHLMHLGWLTDCWSVRVAATMTLLRKSDIFRAGPRFGPIAPLVSTKCDASVMYKVPCSSGFRCSDSTTPAASISFRGPSESQPSRNVSHSPSRAPFRGAT